MPTIIAVTPRNHNQKKSSNKSRHPKTSSQKRISKKRTRQKRQHRRRTTRKRTSRLRTKKRLKPSNQQSKISEIPMIAIGVFEPGIRVEGRNQTGTTETHKPESNPHSVVHPGIAKNLKSTRYLFKTGIISKRSDKPLASRSRDGTVSNIYIVAPSH